MARSAFLSLADHAALMALPLLWDPGSERKFQEAITAASVVRAKTGNLQVEVAISTLLAGGIVSLLDTSNSKVVRSAVLIAFLASLSATASGSILAYNLQSPYALWLVSEDANARFDRRFSRELRTRGLVVHLLLFYALAASVTAVVGMVLDSNQFRHEDAFRWDVPSKAVVLTHTVILSVIPLILWNAILRLLYQVKTKIDDDPAEYLYQTEDGLLPASYVQFASHATTRPVLPILRRRSEANHPDVAPEGRPDRTRPQELPAPYTSPIPNSADMPYAFPDYRTESVFPDLGGRWQERAAAHARSSSMPQPPGQPLDSQRGVQRLQTYPQDQHAADNYTRPPGRISNRTRARPEPAVDHPAKQEMYATPELASYLPSWVKIGGSRKNRVSPAMRQVPHLTGLEGDHFARTLGHDQRDSL